MLDGDIAAEIQAVDAIINRIGLLAILEPDEWLGARQMLWDTAILIACAQQHEQYS